jgi:hypothetical protein
MPSNQRKKKAFLKKSVLSCEKAVLFLVKKKVITEKGRDTVY